jgi:hypothetical protein
MKPARASLRLSKIVPDNFVGALQRALEGRPPGKAAVKSSGGETISK